METTRLSSKGQVIIPQTIRNAHNWPPGLEFSVVDVDDGVFLTPIKHFQSTSVKDVLGCAGYTGAKKSLKDMTAGIAQGARKHK